MVVLNKGVVELDKSCRNCWWLSDEHTSVCTNENSPHYAEFILLNQCCAWYDADETRIAKHRERDDGFLPLVDKEG